MSIVRSDDTQEVCMLTRFLSCLSLIALAASFPHEAGAFNTSPLRADTALSGAFVELAAAEQSDQVAIRIFVRNKQIRGDRMDISFKLRIEGLPTEKRYQFFLQDLGMKLDGLPPAPVPNASHRWAPDDKGELSFNFELSDFAKGEWVQYTIRSIDGGIEKTVRFVPFR